MLNRRQLLTAAATGATLLPQRLPYLDVNALNAQTIRTRKFTMDLCPGRIGANLDQGQSIRMASDFGFESVEPLTRHLTQLDFAQIAALQADLKERELTWGAAGLPVEFRKDESEFARGMRQLPKVAAALSQAGVTRVGTYLSPAHEELTYLANFRQHVHRLRQIATVFADHRIRLGLEYVGPKTSWTRRRHPFIHSLAETLELIAEIGQRNVGLVLDSWHWYAAEEDVSALRALINTQVVAVDLNDAPQGIAVHEQIDNRRELPLATGVIDVHSFLNALLEMDYDGPVRAEPFNQRLNELDDVAAVEATAIAMRRAFETLSK